MSVRHSAGTSASAINGPATSWFHQRGGAVQWHFTLKMAIVICFPIAAKARLATRLSPPTSKQEPTSGAGDPAVAAVASVPACVAAACVSQGGFAGGQGGEGSSVEVVEVVVGAGLE